jgi:hypothetical protein
MNPPFIQVSPELLDQNRPKKTVPRISIIANEEKKINVLKLVCGFNFPGGGGGGLMVAEFLI